MILSLCYYNWLNKNKFVGFKSKDDLKLENQLIFKFSILIE